MQKLCVCCTENSGIYLKSIGGARLLHQDYPDRNQQGRSNMDVQEEYNLKVYQKQAKVKKWKARLSNAL